MERLQRIVKSLKEECEKTSSLSSQVYNAFNEIVVSIAGDLNRLTHSHIFELSKILDEKAHKMHTINMDIEFILESVSDIMLHSVLRSGEFSRGYHANYKLSTTHSNLIPSQINEVSNIFIKYETSTPNKTDNSCKSSLINTYTNDPILKNKTEEKCIFENANIHVEKTNLNLTETPIINNNFSKNEAKSNEQIDNIVSNGTNDDEHIIDNLLEVTLTSASVVSQPMAIQDLLGIGTLKKDDSTLDFHFEKPQKELKPHLFVANKTDMNTSENILSINPPPTAHIRKQIDIEDKVQHATNKGSVKLYRPPHLQRKSHIRKEIDIEDIVQNATNKESGKLYRPPHLQQNFQGRLPKVSQCPENEHVQQLPNNYLSKFWENSPNAKVNSYSAKSPSISNTIFNQDSSPLGSLRSGDSLQSVNPVKGENELKATEICKSNIVKTNKLEYREIDPLKLRKNSLEYSRDEDFIGQEDFNTSYFTTSEDFPTPEDFPTLEDFTISKDFVPHQKDLKMKPIRASHHTKILKADAPNIAFKHSNENPFEVEERKIEDVRSSSRDRSLNMDKPFRDSTLGVVINDRKFPMIETTCSISHSVSPGKFYIHVDDGDYLQLETLMSEIHRSYENTCNQFSSKLDAKNRIGTYCIVNKNIFQYHWYRCKVMNWLENDNKDVRVQLIDYGDVIEEISYENLRLIYPPLFHLPKFAIPCHLAYLYPSGSSSDDREEEWSAETTKIFKQITDDAILKITFANKIGNSFAVELERLDCTDQSIGEFLICHEFAVEMLDEETNKEGNNDEFVTNPIMVSQIKQAQGLAGITKDMTPAEAMEKFLDGSYCNEAGDINEAVTNYNPSDEARTCKFVRQGLVCRRDAGCPYDHAPLRKDGYTTDEIAVFTSAYSDLILPNKGDTIQLKITAVRSLKTFFAQITDYDQEDLKILIANMNRVDNVKNYRHLKLQPIVGQIVAAFHRNNWYRAKVVDTVDSMGSKELEAEVMLVDFGVTANVPLSRLRTIPQVFLNLPFQAVFCILSNIVIKEGVSPMIAMEHFKSRYLCQHLEATVRQITWSGSLEVEMKNNQKDVGLELIEMGIALPTKNFYPADSENVLVD